VRGFTTRTAIGWVCVKGPSAAESCARGNDARRLENAGAMVRDSVALLLNVPSDSFDVRIEPLLPGDLQKKWDELAKLGARPRSYSARPQSAAPRSLPISCKPIT